MKAERLFRAIGLVDEGLIEAAAETPAKKRPVWQPHTAARRAAFSLRPLRKSGPSGGGMRLRRPA